MPRPESRSSGTSAESRPAPAPVPDAAQGPPWTVWSSSTTPISWTRTGWPGWRALARTPGQRLIVAHRRWPASPALSRLGTALTARRPPVVLGHLDRPAVAARVGELLGTACPELLAKLMYEQTAGLPVLLDHLVTGLRDSGQLSPDAVRQLAPRARLDVPAGVREQLRYVIEGAAGAGAGPAVRRDAERRRRHRDPGPAAGGRRVGRHRGSAGGPGQWAHDRARCGGAAGRAAAGEADSGGPHQPGRRPVGLPATAAGRPDAGHRAGAAADQCPRPAGGHPADGCGRRGARCLARAGRPPVHRGCCGRRGVTGPADRPGRRRRPRRTVRRSAPAGGRGPEVGR